jgi:hypothetical protein
MANDVWHRVYGAAQVLGLKPTTLNNGCFLRHPSLNHARFRAAARDPLFLEEILRAAGKLENGAVALTFL